MLDLTLTVLFFLPWWALNLSLGHQCCPGPLLAPGMRAVTDLRDWDQKPHFADKETETPSCDTAGREMRRSQILQPRALSQQIPAVQSRGGCQTRWNFNKLSPPFSGWGFFSSLRISYPLPCDVVESKVWRWTVSLVPDSGVHGLSFSVWQESHLHWVTNKEAQWEARHRVYIYLLETSPPAFLQSF